jgi:hypothetical protein
MSKISVQSHPTEKAQYLGMEGVKVKVTLVQEWVVKVLVEMETLGKEGVKDLVVMDLLESEEEEEEEEEEQVLVSPWV